MRRRRECLGCGERFTTFETLAETNLSVRKRSGSTEPFDRSKLRSSIETACAKRPVSPSEVDSIVRDIELQLYRLRRDHIPTSLIGEAVMERLRELDKPSYIRFASVYKNFEEVGDFRDALKLIK